MKITFLIFFALITCGISTAQNLKWGNVPSLMNGFNEEGKIELVNGKYYQIETNVNNRMIISEYLPEALIWKKRDSLDITITSPVPVTSFHNNIIYIGLEDGTSNEVSLFKFNTLNDNLTPAAPPVTIGLWGTYEMFIHPNGTPYLITNGFYDPLQIKRYNGVSWEVLDLLTLANSGLGGDPRLFYFSTSTNELYIGVSEYDRKVIKIPLSTFTLPSCVVTNILEGASALNSAGVIDFIGDGLTEPKILISKYDGAVTRTYETPYSASPIDIQSLSILPFYIEERHTSLNTQQVSFKLGKSGPSLSTIDNQFLRKYEAGTWSNVGPSLNIPLINGYYYTKASPTDNKAFVAFQEDISLTLFDRAFMLSNAPTLLSAPTPNSALCVGNVNQIYEHIEIEDLDGDKIHVVNVIQSNQSVYSNLNAQYIDQVAGNPSVSKFALYGNALIAGASTTISLVVSDGFVLDTLVLGTVTPSSTQPALSFSSPLLKFCSNENMIELSDKVSTYDGGKFFLNGMELIGTTINGVELAQLVPNPGVDNVKYRTLIDGCLVNATALYEISTVGIATTSSNGAISCGQANGSVTVTFTPGTVSASSVEWSNGQSTFTIDSLEVGPYYFSVTDLNGCHVRGGVGVDPIGVSVTNFISPISCNGANDGAINLTLTGFTNPYIVWSNGATGVNVANLAPGTYWAYIQDVSGCQISRSFKLTEPNPIQATFSTYDPDCGLSNGNVYGTYTGGVGTFTFDWIGTGQATGDLYGVTYGNYLVEVTDQNGCQARFPLELNDYQAVLVNDSVIPTTCTESNGVILIELVDNPFGSLPFISHSWNDQNFMLNRNGLDSGIYIIDVTSGPSSFTGLNCHSRKQIKVGVKAPSPQQICVVTVDTATTTNVVIWEKNGEENISHYNIYRENTQAGHFMKIDTVQFVNESNFNDVVASPEIRSWRYRISPVNTCGVEGPRSIAHKTLHMNSIITQASGTQILWDDYEGPADISNYVVWRYSTQNGWQALSPAVSIGSSSFTDFTASGLTNTDYFVETVLNSTCSAEKVNDFNSSRSNRERGTFAVGEGTGASNNSISEVTLDDALIQVYPNPANDFVTILTDRDNLELKIYNLQGMEVNKTNLFFGENQLDVTSFEAGVYFFILRIGNEEKVVRFIKN